MIYLLPVQSPKWSNQGRSLRHLSDQSNELGYVWSVIIPTTSKGKWIKLKSLLANLNLLANASSCRLVFSLVLHRALTLAVLARSETLKKQKESDNTEKLLKTIHLLLSLTWLDNNCLKTKESCSFVAFWDSKSGVANLVKRSQVSYPILLFLLFFFQTISLVEIAFLANFTFGLTESEFKAMLVRTAPEICRLH